MAGFSIERNGFTNFQKLANRLIKDLIYGPTGTTVEYFKPIYPSNYDDPDTVIVEGINDTTYKAILEASTTVDPLVTTENGNQYTWRIAIDAQAGPNPSGTEHGYVYIYAGTSLQLQNDGEISVERRFQGSTPYRYSGHLTATPRSPGGGTVTYPPFLSATFERTWSSSTPKPDTAAHPYSYRLTVTNRGIALCCWEEGSDDFGDKFSWLVIQRPVNPTTGAILASKASKSPVFCVYSIGGGRPYDIYDLDDKVFEDPTLATSDSQEGRYLWPKIYRFTVRENDVLRPTLPVLAGNHTPDNNAIINPFQQVSITEDNKYVITFPNGFNTDRHLYREELDLIAYTSSDVISQWSDVRIKVYGEATDRIYKAMHANIRDNRGMRMMFLTHGGDANAIGDYVGNAAPATT
jgi:hypothetical protein